MKQGHNALETVLTSELRDAAFLTSEEVNGAWRGLFPDLAGAIPQPYPIYSVDESDVVTHGYPVLEGAALQKLRSALEQLVAVEVDYRVGMLHQDDAEKEQVIERRDVWRKALGALLENAAVSDAGRRLPAVLVLTVAAEASASLTGVRRLLVQRSADIERQYGPVIRFQIARVLARELHRAAHEVGSKLRKLAGRVPSPGDSPINKSMVNDLVPFAVDRVDSDLRVLDGYLELELSQQGERFRRTVLGVRKRLGVFLAEHPDASRLAPEILGHELDPESPATPFEPGTWQLLDRLGARSSCAEPETVHLLQHLGMVLKRAEILLALKRRVLRVGVDGPHQRLVGRKPSTRIARSTRPYDFRRPGVVDSAARRFGLMYDLVTFTSQLEEIRKQGRGAEDRSMRFMFLFQKELRDIAGRHRLRFEKFLGDGAFYSSRRAYPILAAACEIQLLYRKLRSEGFPFDSGIRMALNFATYHLLPMPTTDDGPPRFEFFGHGIVELSRLTSGKSEREAEEIAEYLVHTGFDPRKVDQFLKPLLEAHRDEAAERRGPYAAWLGGSGNLVNRGIVLTAPFLEELERELSGRPAELVDHAGLLWLAWPVDSEKSDGNWFGLRTLGTPSLKGLPPQQLIEVFLWPEPPGTRGERAVETDLLAQLRALSRRETGEMPTETPAHVPEDIVVASYLEGSARVWLFGSYRQTDDMLLHALEVPLTPRTLERGEPVEMWLFRSRFELYRLYEALRRETSGVSVSMQQLRHRDGYVGCFLAAPHRAPA